MDRDRSRDPAKFAHIWGGEYRALSEAQVFRNWRVGEMTVPDDVVWFYGADWGFATDPTAALRCCIPRDGVLYVDSEVYAVGVPTDALPGLLAGLPDATKWPMRGDNARPETIDYLRRHGFPRLHSATKGRGSVEDGVTFLQGMDIVVHPKCVNLARELRTYAYRTDPRTNEILPVIEDANNHAVDALRYAVEGLHRRGKKLKPGEAQANDKLDRPRDSYSRRDDTDSNWRLV
jgi:phage terminase large subunit